MYVYLEENRNAYHKGQLTPFFIAILTILIIASFVIINIGKVGIDRTYVSNTVDSGALAGASVMAGLYSSLAEMKEKMKESWNSFLASYLLFMAIFWATMLSIQAAIEEAQQQGEYAVLFMVLALAAAALCTALSCGDCPDELMIIFGLGMVGAVTFLSWGITNLRTARQTARGIPGMIDSLKKSLASWHGAMHEAYASLKESVKEAWQAALDTALKVAWGNTGATTKMTEEQQEEFSDWMDDGAGNEYSWDDPSGRNHKITVNVTIAGMTEFVWQVTNLTKPEIDNLWEHSRAEILDLIHNTGEAKKGYYYAILALVISMIGGILGNIFCEPCKNCKSYDCAVFCPLFIAGQIMFIGGVIAAMVLTLEELNTHIPYALENIEEIKDDLDEIAEGMLPGRRVTNPAVGGPEILCWLDAMPHSHTVSPVTSTQLHEGKDYTIWNTEYPKISGSASASFGGATSDLSPLGWTANLISAD